MLAPEPPRLTWIADPRMASADSARMMHAGATDSGPVDASMYEDLGAIGVGGMGEVRRVWDPRLRREVAMKLLHRRFVAEPSMYGRFVEEAQATAQLEHPGIVPIHALGRTDDGRPFFTMKEVKGKTLTVRIAEVHGCAADGQWLPTPSGWTFHRLVHAFHQVCESVGFAHARGVIHRDLKPDNIMVGAHGEVLVVDWGLAKVVGRHPDDEVPLVETDRSLLGAHSTRAGVVAGTPNYMPPEQARGEPPLPSGDVYALGSVLYEILTGHPPFEGTGDEVLDQVRAKPPPRLLRAGRTWTPGARAATASPLPPEPLVDVCERAMSRAPADRYANAGEFARAVLDFLEGARAREQALALVADADALVPRIAALSERAGALRALARSMAASVRGYAPVAEKRAGWEKEDEAGELERRAAVDAVQRIQLLRGALSLDRECPEAHAGLAEHYREKMAEAEITGDPLLVRQYEWYLRAHDDGKNAVWLRGDGALTVVSEPPGAAIAVHRWVERDRRMVLEPLRNPGRTPLRAWPLPMGSYVVVLRKEGHVPVRYPVEIGRCAHWDGIPPGATEPAPIRLPRVGEIDDDEVYVPTGWFWSGGDPESTGGLPRRRVWLDAFVIRRFPATNRQWIAFLDALAAEGRDDDALRWAPRERPGGVGAVGNLVYGRGEDGRFFLQPDGEGDLWDPEWPAMLIDWRSAMAFVEREAARTGRAYRLPWELEWEKAARGVDGRAFPWGNHLDPTFTNMRDSFPDRPMPAVVDSFPVDESPYGVRGMAGNVRDWCLDLYRLGGPAVVDGRFVPPGVEAGANRTLRGGAFTAYRRSAGVAFRLGDSGESRIPYVGVRLCRSMWK